MAKTIKENSVKNLYGKGGYRFFKVIIKNEYMDSIYKYQTENKLPNQSAALNAILCEKFSKGGSKK